MPLQATSGAASYDAFGGGVAVVPSYIEDVFSCFLYTGTGSAQTITNGIDLSGKGGLAWAKNRSSGGPHVLVDTARGNNNFISSNNTDAQTNNSAFISTLNSDGFSVGVNMSDSGKNFVSWTFREQPKFFDVVTWSGNSTARTIAHNLGSAPGCIIVKAYSGTDAATANWAVYHRSLGNDYWLKLENTGAALSSGNLLWTTTVPTATEFSLGGGGVTEVNRTGNNYVAYLFAHDAGGFGLTGTDNVISCGSFTTNGSGNATVSLGYEPQYLMLKCTNAVSSWLVQDNMRGFSYGNYAELYPNSSSAEGAGTPGYIAPTATGFSTVGTTNILGASNTYIYIAIRRGPMKVPTSGTSVFLPSVQTGVNTSTGQFITTGFPPDLSIEASAGVSSGAKWTIDRLRGNSQFLATDVTAAESSIPPYGITYTISNVGVQNVNYGTTTISYVDWLFRRAPSFFDEVCYTGNSTGGRSITHNLGVVPEILIVKKRSSGAGWPTLITSAMRVMEIDNDAAYRSAADTKFYYGDGSSDIAPTSSVFTVASGGDVNGSGSTYVAYLFASCPGVSKVGSYTGNGSTQTINCGFTTGARFVLIKRTDSNGDWYVYDTARGMTSGTAPYASLDNAGGSTATAGSVTTVSTGFALDAAALAAINTNAASYIFLAIA